MKRMALIRPAVDDAGIAAQERREPTPAQARADHLDAGAAGALLRGHAPPPAGRARHPPVGWDALTDEQRDEVSAVFDTEISPVLTPLSLDAAHPFPFVSNLSTSWAFRLEDPSAASRSSSAVKVPGELPQWLRVRAGVAPADRVFVSLEEVIAANADKLFPGMAIDEREPLQGLPRRRGRSRRRRGSKRALVEEELRQRRFEPVVRLEVQPNADREMVAELKDRFPLTAEDVYEMTRAARLHDAVRDRRARHRGAARPAVDAAAADRARGGRRRHLRRDPPRRHPAAPARTTASTPASSASSARPPTIRRRCRSR